MLKNSDQFLIVLLDEFYNPPQKKTKEKLQYKAGQLYLKKKKEREEKREKRQHSMQDLRQH